MEGYDKSNPIVAGIGLMTHPSEWPTLCDEYPVIRYLQHSEWTAAVYRSYYGNRCAVWPVGIDTDYWTPVSESRQSFDFLIYNKIMWDRNRREVDLVSPIRNALAKRGLTFLELVYGRSPPEQEYRAALAESRAMIFLCEHESQGLAYQECLSSNVPILAWDQGWCLDPNRFKWGDPEIPATSVPSLMSDAGLRLMTSPICFGKLDPFLQESKGVLCPANLFWRT